MIYNAAPKLKSPRGLDGSGRYVMPAAVIPAIGRGNVSLGRLQVLTGTDETENCILSPMLRCDTQHYVTPWLQRSKMVGSSTTPLQRTSGHNGEGVRVKNGRKQSNSQPIRAHAQRYTHLGGKVVRALVLVAGVTGGVRGREEERGECGRQRRATQPLVSFSIKETRDS